MHLSPKLNTLTFKLHNRFVVTAKLINERKNFGWVWFLHGSQNPTKIETIWSLLCVANLSTAATNDSTKAFEIDLRTTGGFLTKLVEIDIENGTWLEIQFVVSIFQDLSSCIQTDSNANFASSFYESFDHRCKDFWMSLVCQINFLGVDTHSFCLTFFASYPK